ncbi:glycosyl transferase family 90-domain-containing protein [Coniochaeta sp. 2T2.1]|nr:glycosyl transferase family 90-domain-containing protein [Coniochaeta sp. 2T2.1]
MKTSRPRVWRPIYFLIGACSSCYLVLFFSFLDEFSIPGIFQLTRSSSVTNGRHPLQNTHTSLDLTTEQCESTFPGLTKDIESTVALGSFKIQPSGSDGPLQVSIKDGKMLVYQSERIENLSTELLDAQTATLHQLHRAVITTPTRLPDTIITINVNDQPFGSAFSYTRPAFRPPSSGSHGPSLTRAFLMPHFSFWAWPLPSIGSITRAGVAIRIIESQIPFSRKDRRVAWRGTMGWNSAQNPASRENLLRSAEDADWADIQALHGYDIEVDESTTISEKANTTSTNNALMIEDFCRYKYVLYTEGITYSGRLQFLQMCRSVLISAPIAWLQHSTHLVRPLFSSDILIQPEHDSSREGSHGSKEAWPIHYPPQHANAVFVSPDWSDLEQTVAWLERNPRAAEGIAERQRNLFVGQGYLSSAAEACYWRALIRGWSETVRYENSDWDGRRPVAWELFSLGGGGSKVG